MYCILTNLVCVLNEKPIGVHTASAEYLTHFAIHEKRGTQATIDIGIMPEFTGTMVHDHWKLAALKCLSSNKMLC
jgi:hypothetical protein